MDRYETDINRKKETGWKGGESEGNKRARGRHLREQRCGKIGELVSFHSRFDSNGENSENAFRAPRWELGCDSDGPRTTRSCLPYLRGDNGTRIDLSNSITGPQLISRWRLRKYSKIFNLRIRNAVNRYG